jgi:hypothetical protein
MSEFGEVAVISAPAAKYFLRPLQIGMKIVNWTSSSHGFQIETYLQKFREGLPKHILEKNIFQKKGCPTMGI